MKIANTMAKVWSRVSMTDASRIILATIAFGAVCAFFLAKLLLVLRFHFLQEGNEFTRELSLFDESMRQFEIGMGVPSDLETDVDS